jgi:hypothetical protein
MNRFCIGPLHNCWTFFDFDVEFAEIFVIEKRLPALKDMGSRQEILTLSFFSNLGDSKIHLYTDKKENQIFLIYREIQSGAVAKSYMRKGFPI